MFTIREYAMPETLDPEAYTILKSRKAIRSLADVHGYD